MQNIYRSEDSLVKAAESEAIRRFLTAYEVAETSPQMERLASRIFMNQEVFEYFIVNMVRNVRSDFVSYINKVRLTELELMVLKRVMDHPDNIPGGHGPLFTMLADALFAVAVKIGDHKSGRLHDLAEFPHGSMGEIVLEMLEKPVATKLLQSLYLSTVARHMRNHPEYADTLQRLLRPIVDGLGENRHEQATTLISDWLDKNTEPPPWLMKEFDDIMSGKVGGEKLEEFRRVVIEWIFGVFHLNNFPAWSAKYLEMLMRGDPPYHVMTDERRELQSRIMENFPRSNESGFVKRLLADAMLSGRINENSYINKLTNYLISEKNVGLNPKIKDEWLEPVVGKLLRDGRFRDEEGRQAAAWWLQKMGGGELETSQKTASVSTPHLWKDRFDELIRTMLSAASKRMSSSWQPPLGAGQLKTTEELLRDVWKSALTKDVPDVLHNHMIAICEQYGGWPGRYVSAMRFLPQLIEKYGEAITLLSIMKTKTADDFEDFMFRWHPQYKKNMAETEAVMEYKKTFKIGENMHWRVELLATAPAISAHSTHDDHPGIDSNGVAKPLLVYDIDNSSGHESPPLHEVGSLLSITPKNPKHQGEGYTVRINSMDDLEEYFGSTDPKDSDMYSNVKTSVVNEHGQELDRDAWRAVVLGRPMPKGFVMFVEQNATPEMSDFLVEDISDTEWEGNENDALDDLQSGQSLMNLIIRRLEALVQVGSESRLKQFLLNVAADRELLESFSSAVNLYGSASWKSNFASFGGDSWSRRNAFATKIGNVITKIAKENSDSTPESLADLVFAMMHSRLIGIGFSISVPQQASPCRWIKRLWALTMLSGDLGDIGRSAYVHDEDDGSGSPSRNLNPEVMRKMLPDSQAASDLIERSYIGGRIFREWSPAMAQLDRANEDSELPTVIKDMIDIGRQDFLTDKRATEYAERYCRLHGHVSEYSKKIMIANVGYNGGILSWNLEPKKGVPEFAVMEIAKECAKGANSSCKRTFLQALASQLIVDTGRKATPLMSLVFKLLFDDLYTYEKIKIFRYYGVLPPYILHDKEITDALHGMSRAHKLDGRLENLLQEHNSGMSIQQAMQTWKSQVASIIGIS